MNYRTLDKEEKQELKPLVDELRKQLYEKENEESLDGLVINFGKKEEERFTVKIDVIT